MVSPYTKHQILAEQKLHFEELLAGRRARCTCMRPETYVPSTEYERLAFFEYRGPGSETATEHCKHCHYHRVAHEPEHMATLVPNPDGTRRETVVEDGRCPGFEVDSARAEFDLYYCGHGGWD